MRGGQWWAPARPRERPSPDVVARELVRCAVHELGHAVASLHAGLHIDHVYCWTYARGDGRLSYSARCVPEEGLGEISRMQMAISQFGGVVTSELVGDPRARHRGSIDRRTIRELRLPPGAERRALGYARSVVRPRLELLRTLAPQLVEDERWDGPVVCERLGLAPASPPPAWIRASGPLTSVGP